MVSLQDNKLELVSCLQKIHTMVKNKNASMSLTQDEFMELISSEELKKVKKTLKWYLLCIYFYSKLAKIYHIELMFLKRKKNRLFKDKQAVKIIDIKPILLNKEWSDVLKMFPSVVNDLVESNLIEFDKDIEDIKSDRFLRISLYKKIFIDVLGYIK